MPGAAGARERETPAANGRRPGAPWPWQPVAEPGLRARKRIGAMLLIQNVAMDLFEQRGFDAVTVEEIAEAAQVSPSSVYRYFGTKEHIVLWDQLDQSIPGMIASALSDQVPLDGLRRVVMEALDGLSEADEAKIERRVRLLLSHPVLEQATLAHSYAAVEMFETALAQRLGRPAVDLEVQVFAHALIGGLIGMVHHWRGTEFRDRLRDITVRAFEIFEEGLDIVTAPATAGNGEPASASASA